MTRLKKMTMYAAAATLLAAPAFAVQPSTSFTVSQMTAIPGKTLPPGHYSIQVLDHLSDRYIVQVTGPDGGQTLFLGVPDSHLPGSRPGMIDYAKPANQAEYVRGWRFASLSTPIEFVYPKADAVAIAKANGTQVAAIDPASDHLQTGDLTQNQMQIVTLWLLTPTRVGPSSPAGIAARRYDEVARVDQPPVVKKLPHTASDLPLIWMTAAFSLLGAAGLRARALAARHR